MSAGEYQLDIGDTIAMVNMVRHQFGKDMISELPNATYGDPAACLFYRALSDCGAKSVDGRDIKFASERQAAIVAELWGVNHDGSQVRVPQQFTSMVSAFDGDYVPQYNIDA